jgi:hypothetical protein
VGKGLPYSRLPAAMRAQVDAQLGKADRKRTQRAATGPGLPLRCTRCTFTTDQPTDDRLAAHAATHPGVAVRYEWRPGMP